MRGTRAVAAADARLARACVLKSLMINYGSFFNVRGLGLCSAFYISKYFSDPRPPHSHTRSPGPQQPPPPPPNHPLHHKDSHHDLLISRDVYILFLPCNSCFYHQHQNSFDFHRDKRDSKMFVIKVTKSCLRDDGEADRVLERWPKGTGSVR